MQKMFLVMAGGAIGSALRYQLGQASLRLLGPSWPSGTFIANVSGGLFMGLLSGWLLARTQGGESVRLFLAVGLLGGFTTFSAFSLETMSMIERGALMTAMGYALISVVASIAALALGLSLVRTAAV